MTAAQAKLLFPYDAEEYICAGRILELPSGVQFLEALQSIRVLECARAMAWDTAKSCRTLKLVRQELEALERAALICKELRRRDTAA